MVASGWGRSTIVRHHGELELGLSEEVQPRAAHTQRKLLAQDWQEQRPGGRKESLAEPG